MRGQAKEWSDEEKAIVERYIADGRSYSWIGMRIGADYHMVKRLCEKMGKDVTPKKHERRCLRCRRTFLTVSHYICPSCHHSDDFSGISEAHLMIDSPVTWIPSHA